MPMNQGSAHKGLTRALLLCSSLSAGVSWAQDNADTAGYEVRTQPSICVSYDSTQACTMAFTVSWVAPHESAVCLREADEAEPLHCWDPARSGSIELSYSDTQDVTYQLVALDGTLLATTEIKVINRDLRSSRSRRRHVWSIL
jgi:hypothetical protein